MNEISHSRRGFLKLGSAAIMGAGVLLTLKPSKAWAVGDQVTSAIDSNHGHQFQMSLTDLIKNGATTYNIQGSSKHPHTINLTGEMIAALQGGTNVEIESSTDKGHSHAVLLSLV